jgi:hypothetical protein
LDQAINSDRALELFGLVFRALVAPDQRRSDDFVVLVHKDGAMHLARKANCGDGLGRQA